MRRSAPRSAKKRVCFVCIGNSCRSQMAEGFARAYGTDVLEASSAGLAPASIVQLLTRKVMAARNIVIDDQFPKGLFEAAAEKCDILVNMSGVPLPPETRAEVITWKVEDPIGASEEFYTKIRDQIETLVMGLILQIRAAMRPPGPGKSP